MVREVISLGVGQGGIQLSEAVWRQYNAEHKVESDGQIKSKSSDEDQNALLQTFYNESNMGNYVPRNLFIDLEKSVIDDVKKSDIGDMFNRNFFIDHKQDAANNFARGHYTVGKEKLDAVTDALKKLAEECDNLQGFICNHSVGGGTGSGMGMLILEQIAVEHRKKSKIGFEIYPSPTISTCIVEPYNGLLSTHWLLDHTDVSLILDNEAIYQICHKNLEIKAPSYANLNRLIAKVVSSMTASLRFEGELNVDMNEFQTNLVPFPRLHFMTTSLAPIISKAKGKTSVDKVQTITTEALKPSNFFVRYPDFEVTDDLYMAISLNYRGKVTGEQATAAVNWVKKNNKASFVPWCPTGFKIGMNSTPAAAVKDDDVSPNEINVTMIGNNVAVNSVFKERLSNKYDKMYSQRAYVHWYVGEGMEEGEFSEAREDLGFLEKDYLDVVAEQNSDEEEPDEDDM